MRRFRPIAALLCLLPTLAAAQRVRLVPPTPPARDPAEILKKYDTMTRPVLDLQGPDEVEQLLGYQQKLREWRETRATVAGEFAREFPEHPRANRLMLERWVLLRDLERSVEALDEMEAVLKGQPRPYTKSLADLLRLRAMMMLRQSRYGGESLAKRSSNLSKPPRRTAPVGKCFGTWRIASPSPDCR